MKLNPGIIFDNLQAHVKIEMSGSANDDLLLDRPLLYSSEEQIFLPRVLYVAMADRLPQRPVLNKEAVILCVGDNLHVSHYRERCCFMQIREKVDFFHVVNLVQEVFNTYDRWNEKLLEIVSSTANIREILECSSNIFGNPLFVIDSDFHLLASAGYDEKIPSSAMGSAITVHNLNLPTMAQFLDHHELSTHVKESMLMNLLDTSTLNTNLFNSNDEYIGCLTIDYRLRPHRTSDIPLARHLTSIIVQALQKLSVATSNERTLLKRALQDAVSGLPMTAEQNRSLESAEASRRFACVKMKLSNRFAPLPAEYICAELETKFPKSIAFEYDAAIVGFIEMEDVESAEKQGGSSLRESIDEFIKAMDIRVGVSDQFDGLRKANLFYKQASAAFESGALLCPNERLFVFQDLALAQMIVNMIDELPVEMYYPQGLRHLLEHDMDASISYAETLRVYLEQNMNVSRAAAELYVHRSTLLERISRIEKVLGSDLKDPDERLRIQILLKAMQITDQIRMAPAVQTQH